MLRRTMLLLSLALLALPAAALASCEGSSCTCSLEPSGGWTGPSLSLDLTQEYLDLDQPRAGREDVSVGFISSEEDEVRTINRITSLRGLYRPSAEWALTAKVPYVSRTHEHFHNHPGEPPELMHWSYSGLGDAEIGAARTILGRAGEGREVRLNATLKLPTGRRNVPEIDGHQPEPPARPGSGSWDTMLGLSARAYLKAPAPGASDRATVFRADVLGRWNGKGTDDYRAGREIEAHAGAEYPLAGPVDLLAQANFRVQAKDDVGDSDAERDNTGGTWAYFTPGLRCNVVDEIGIYALVQIPVYQRVNRIQLVSGYNLYFGVSRSLL